MLHKHWYFLRTDPFGIAVLALRRVKVVFVDLSEMMLCATRLIGQYEDHRVPCQSLDIRFSSSRQQLVYRCILHLTKDAYYGLL